MYDLYTSIHLMCKYLIFINIHCDVNSIHKKICVFYGESVSQFTHYAPNSFLCTNLMHPTHCSVQINEEHWSTVIYGSLKDSR